MGRSTGLQTSRRTEGTDLTNGRGGGRRNRAETVPFQGTLVRTVFQRLRVTKGGWGGAWNWRRSRWSESPRDRLSCGWINQYALGHGAPDASCDAVATYVSAQTGIYACTRQHETWSTF